MGNTCCSFSKGPKTGSDTEPENWEEQRENRNGGSKKQQKKRKKTKAAKYVPNQQTGDDSDAKTNLEGSSDAAEPDVVFVEANDPETGFSERHREPSLCNDATEESESPAKISAKSDRSFLNAVFVPDEEGATDVSDTVKVTPLQSTISKRGSSAISPVSPIEKSNFKTGGDVIDDSRDVIKLKFTKDENTAAVADDTGFQQLSPRDASSAGHEADADNRLYPYAGKRGSKYRKPSAELAKSGRDNLTPENDRTAEQGDSDGKRSHSNELSTASVKLVIKESRSPVRRASDDVIVDFDVATGVATKDNAGETRSTTVVGDIREKEDFLNDVTQKKAAYEASLSNVNPWLADSERRIECINDKTLPAEQNALQVSIQEVEDLLEDVARRAQALQQLEDSACDVIDLPQEAVESGERAEMKKLSASTRERYDSLQAAAQRKLAELDSALSKSRPLTGKIEPLFTFVDDAERDLGRNERDTVAESPKTTSSLDEANKKSECESGETEEAHEALARWLDSNESALHSIGLSMSPNFDLQQKLSIRGEDLEKLDDFIQKFCPVTYKTLMETTESAGEESPAVLWQHDEQTQRAVADDESRIIALESALRRHLTAKKEPDEKLDAFIDRATSCEKELGELRTRLDDLAVTSLGSDCLKTTVENMKHFIDGIKFHRGLVDSIVSEGKTLTAFCDEADSAKIKKHVDAVGAELDAICQRYRSSQIERSLPMADSYVKARDDLVSWLRVTRRLLENFTPLAVLTDDLKVQQDEAKALKNDVAVRRSVVDKLNKVGTGLSKLLVADNPSLASDIEQSIDDVKKGYAAVREVVNKRAATVESALEESNQFFGRIKSLCDQLFNLREGVSKLPPVTIEAEEIKERIRKIKLCEAQIGKLSPTFNSVKALGEQLLKRTDGDTSQMSKHVVEEEITAAEKTRNELSKLVAARLRSLVELLGSCQQFWSNAESLNALMRDLGETISREVGVPPVELVAIKRQIEHLEVLCEKLCVLEKDLESVREEAKALCSSDGSSRPLERSQRTMEVTKVDDELIAAWNELHINVSKTRFKLEEAMTEAVGFQEAVQRTVDHLVELNEKVERLAPVATELATVKAQEEELKEVKKETHFYQIELERLYNQGELMAIRAKDDSESMQLRASVLKMREAWKKLSERILSRQHALQTAMLALGQLHHAIQMLAEWLGKTEQQLDAEQPPPAEDPKQAKIELAKHKILWHEISAHKSTLDSLTYAAHELSQTNADEASSPAYARDSLAAETDRLTSQWEEVNAKAEARQWELEDWLEKAEARQRELDVLSRWIRCRENERSQSFPCGGVPETALGQLNAHKILMDELDRKKELLERFMSSGSDSAEAELLQEKMKVVEADMLQRKATLEGALEQAQQFKDNWQAFDRFLIDAEKALDGQKAPSIVPETLGMQLKDQKALEDGISLHCDVLLDLEKLGSHLVYFSQKQDGTLIKNRLSSVRARWAKVNTRVSDRSRLLNESSRKVHQFSEAWNELHVWLDVSQKSLSENLAQYTSPDKIRVLLDDHKEFQRAVASRRLDYDAVTVSGKFLREKGHTYGDKGHVDEKLRQLKEKWDALHRAASERQNDLEDALMASGRLKDAVDFLLEWFYEVEPLVASDASVLGDVHTVSNLIDQHNALLVEIKAREGIVMSLQESSAGNAGCADSSWVKGQTEELSKKWNGLCKSAADKEARLASAKFQAEEFQISTQEILDWLAASETNLNLDQQLPDDEFQLQELRAADQEFAIEAEKKEEEVKRTLALGSAILAHAHPVAVAPIKHWLAVLQSRWEEVTAWVKHRGEQVDSALSEMEAKEALWEELMGWLKNAESGLDISDDQPMPEKSEEIERLIEEHQTFQNEMLKRQPDYSKLTNSSKRSTVQRDDLKRPNTPDPLREDDVPGLQLQNKWQRLWLKTLDRQQRLQNAHDAANQRSGKGDFSFNKWRSRYMKSMGNKKSRVMDSFRRIDTDGDGKIGRREFCDEIMKSKFRTTKAEAERVADLFDQNKDGRVDYYQFVAALHPSKESYKPQTDADKIEDEVMRQIAKCTCSKRFQVQQIAENKYRFGDNQQLRLVRILRSTVMVRVGGGWMSLEEFLAKNDPCRAKGRSNTELREKFVLPPGATQQMAAFRTKRSGTSRSLQSSSGSSQSTSPSRGPATPDSHSATPKKNGRGHECGKHPKSTRSRHSSGSSDLSSSPSVSSAGATAGDTSPPRTGAISPVHPSPARHAASKSRSTLPRVATPDGSKRSKIPTTTILRKKP